MVLVTNSFQVSGRILIDFYGYAKHHKGLERIEKPSKNQRSNQYKDRASDGGSTYLKPLDDKEQQANKAEMLVRRTDLMFISPMLSGFALREKLWRKTSAAVRRYSNELTTTF